MSKLTKSPQNVFQTSGTQYVSFSGLNNIKNTSTSTYAISSTYIQPKKSTKQNRPATVSVNNFKFNIPSSAVVKKITVHYRHSIRARCKQGNDYVPCALSNVDYRCNIPAPTITVLNTKLSKKGQSPYAKVMNPVKSRVTTEYGKLNNTVTFKGYWDASVVNSTNFGVRINYPANTNNLTGYVLLNYIYVDIEYFNPSFTVSAQSTNPDKVYNKEQYHLKINLSDSNLTKRTTNVLVSIPIGFNYRGVAGTLNGKINSTSSRTLQWTPNMSNGNASAELVFDTDVSFAQSQTSQNFNFTIGLPSYSKTIGYTATIYKELPPEKQIEGEDSKQSFTDDDAKPEISPMVWGVLNNAFRLTFEFTDEEIERYKDDVGQMPLKFMAYSENGGLSNKWYYSDENNVTGARLTNNTWTMWSYEEDNYVYDDYFKVRNNIGVYTLKCYASVGGGLSSHMVVELVRELKIYIKPQESSLTVPNFTILKLSNEECNRLGNNYSYTVQSDLQLNTEETYSRDWYKNFRLGVFNNPILANITSYYQYKNTDASFDGYFTIPPLYSLEGATLTVETDADIVLDGETVTTTKVYTDIEEFNIPIHFEKASENNVILTLTLTGGTNQVLWTKDLHILFESDESTNIEEISTDNTDYDSLTDVEIFSNAEYWATEVAGLNVPNSVECEFPYNKKYPLYVLITGDYPEGDQSGTIEFSEPCLIETSQYTEREENGVYPFPIDDLVVINANTSQLTLTPYEQSETIVFYNLPLEDGYGTDTEKAIRGIELVGTIEQADTLVLYAKLKSPTGASKERSIVINDFETTIDAENEFCIGGIGDLWGFNTLDIVELDNWEVEFRIANILGENDSTINFGEIKLILYIETVQKQNITCKIEGEDIAYYGAFITDLTIPEGLETDTDYLSVDGTDINDAYRQNIREKQISIEFDIGDGCDLETSTLSLREFAKLLINDRDEYNRPIPKRIEFSHYPDVFWEYVMEDAFDSEININTYQVKANLIVPAGTSYDKKTTITSNTGYVNGLASINPILIVKPADEVITIRETVSGQEFHIAYSGGWNDKILEIDCENRVCWLETDENDSDPININKYVDYNSDWFVLKGEFEFEGINCIIRTVGYQERW